MKSLNEWPNLQNAFYEFSTECNKIIDIIKNEKDDLAQQVSRPNFMTYKIKNVNIFKFL